MQWMVLSNNKQIEQSINKWLLFEQTEGWNERQKTTNEWPIMIIRSYFTWAKEAEVVIIQGLYFLSQFSINK